MLLIIAGLWSLFVDD